MSTIEKMYSTAERCLTKTIIPFWKSIRDDEYGGYYGYVGFDLAVDKKADKGCILNSRILWFFSSAYTLLGDKELLEEAVHAYMELKEVFTDKEKGGVYWSVDHKGQVKDSTKHTYNQAFAIYGLAAFYEASGDTSALKLAMELYKVIEDRCRDDGGYLEALDRSFNLIDNDKLSENGVMADRTMNTLLHIMEAYTELYRVSHDRDVRSGITAILDIFADKIYNPELHRQEVFFDREYNSILDLHSYGHDIEASWLIDRAVQVIDEDGAYQKKMNPITSDLSLNILNNAFDGSSLAYECEKGVVRTTRAWWVQAETVIGFINGYMKDSEHAGAYIDAAEACLNYIEEYFIDHRDGSEWYSEVEEDGTVNENMPMVNQWKCPYHNGRMCIEIINRLATD